MATILETLREIGLVPVITIDRTQDAVPLAQALLDGDIACVEVTFRTAAAADAIHLMSTVSQGLLVGAGTVLTVQQAEQAAQAGARYIVSPGFDPSVVDWCQTHNMAVLPGVATPTEIMMALAKGLTLLKFFPAEVVGGARMLDMLYAPFADVRFVPTGGITTQNLARYLALPNVVAGGGSWMATKSMIADHKFAEITRVSRAARALVRQVRGEREGRQ
jgi:2-dehydro-3-deoxyphosphogluconate aldolase/(4S)-4-hydroxy-2-oxoglutarate aldolase